MRFRSNVGLARCVLLTLVCVLLMCVAPASSSAMSPWWDVTSGAEPTDLPPGGEGTLIVGVSDVGDVPAEGAGSPIEIVDGLPSDLTATGSISAQIKYGNQDGAPLACSAATLSCETSGTLAPGQLIEIFIKVRVGEGAVSGELNHVSVSGGGAPPLSVTRPVSIGESTGFGVEENELSLEEEGGQPPAQAGSHPFQVTSTIVLNHQANGEPVALAKDVGVELPAGLVGNPAVTPKCTIGQFLKLAAGVNANECAPQTALGVAMIHVYSATVGNFVFTVPVFNLEPAYGEPARFGFYFTQGKAPVILDTSLRSGPGEDYGITVTSHNITQSAAFISSQITFWGTPGDPRHDPMRGWGCLDQLYHGEEPIPCIPAEESHPEAFQILPTSCSDSPLQAFAQADSWEEPANRQTLATSEPLPTLDGCNRLPFSPSMNASPTTTNASSASGLDFNIGFNDEGLTAPEGLAQSNLNRTEVQLPEGLTINPSAGVGLAGCTSTDYARETLDSAPGAGCPSESKLGTVTIETPLLSSAIDGSVFIAQPYENPFDSLVALYVVAKNPETGVLVKLAGKVTPNPVTGQLTTVFENNPQLPFDHFNFHFREGAQAPLITPALCGTYATQAVLSPWSEPTAPLADVSSVTLTKGSDGGECPTGGLPPFKPGILAGSLNNSAGSYSPFYIDLTRTDAEQEISSFSTELPVGVTGNLTGIPFCPDTDIEAARHNTGRAEEANQSCPAASQIGHTLVGTGVGSVLAYVPGKIYLAGSFEGDPFSVVSITSAVVGPFDLGTVVIRFGLKIDPHTGQVSVDPTGSEPIPTIIDGIVTHVRDIRVYIDRSDFTLNPTSCNPLSISSTLTSEHGQTATVSSRYQSADCGALGFKPSFKVSTNGKTSRKNGASLTVKLTYPRGAQANIRSVKVDLPKQMPSRLPTLQKACPAHVFETNPAACPRESIVGHAKAITPVLPVPIEGPAYFVSNGGEAFPNLIVVLQGYGVTIDLVGDTFINEHTNVTSSTFKTVPDEPVTSFELSLPQGPYSALAANKNLCTQKLVMPTMFTAQNGMTLKQSTPITVTGCTKHKKAKMKAKHKRKK